MNRALIAFTLCWAAGCYTPRGSYQAVDAYDQGEGGEYLIVPGDVLNVTVFQQAALSAKVKVRQDGRVSLPLVNEWSAAGKSPRKLAIELQTKLKDFVNNPAVTVSLEEGRPLSVSVVGEVVRTGVVTLDPNSGVLQALAAAGGLTELAHREGIFVVRVHPEGLRPSRILFTWDRLVRGEGRAAMFRLAAGDVVVVE